jgi:hypothetical protein
MRHCGEKESVVVTPPLRTAANCRTRGLAPARRSSVTAKMASQEAPHRDRLVYTRPAMDLFNLTMRRLLSFVLLVTSSAPHGRC